jgi:TonB family protein
MKTLSVMLLFLCITANCFSQIKNDSIFIGSSSQSCGSDLGTAHFPGGFDEMNKFINANFHMPDSVKTATLSASVMLKISIDTTGTLTSISVLKGVNKSIDNEVLRVFSIMPKWIPGIKEGKKISETFALPVRIELGKAEKKK